MGAVAFADHHDGNLAAILVLTFTVVSELNFAARAPPAAPKAAGGASRRGGTASRRGAHRLAERM